MEAFGSNITIDSCQPNSNLLNKMQLTRHASVLVQNIT